MSFNRLSKECACKNLIIVILLLSFLFANNCNICFADDYLVNSRIDCSMLSAKININSDEFSQGFISSKGFDQVGAAIKNITDKSTKSIDKQGSAALLALLSEDIADPELERIIIKTLYYMYVDSISDEEAEAAALSLRHILRANKNNGALWVVINDMLRQKSQAVGIFEERWNYFGGQPKYILTEQVELYKPFPLETRAYAALKLGFHNAENAHVEASIFEDLLRVALNDVEIRERAIDAFFGRIKRKDTGAMRFLLVLLTDRYPLLKFFREKHYQNLKPVDIVLRRPKKETIVLQSI